MKSSSATIYSKVSILESVERLQTEMAAEGIEM